MNRLTHKEFKLELTEQLVNNNDEKINDIDIKTIEKYIKFFLLN